MLTYNARSLYKLGATGYRGNNVTLLSTLKIKEEAKYCDWE
jgi:hypothetical protein